MTVSLDRPVTSALLTEDGGARQPDADLWCTYAAIRALHWLDSGLADADGAARFLLAHQNSDGGFAWQRGLQSDVWATFYSTQALLDLGRPTPRLDALREWLGELTTEEGGLPMTPGQNADVWSTYYGVRTWTEILDARPPNATRIFDWLGRLQLPGGGLGWADGSPKADVRACYYGTLARGHLCAAGVEGASFEARGVAAWVRERQQDAGGFAFDEEAGEADLWATFRATRCLRELAREPADPAACVRWIRDRQRADGGFGRWDWYDVSDVWATFSAAGALIALDRPLTDRSRAGAIEFLQSCQIGSSGCTYRSPEAAGDALATAAVVLVGETRGEHHDDACAWLRRAQMPAEGGVMYMPARGAEVRCTQWATAALRLAGARPLDRERLGRWLRALQNPDGGFGLWEGRGSDVSATVAALEIAHDELGGEGVDHRAARTFLESCLGEDGVRFSPRGGATAASTAQGIRALGLAGARETATALAATLDGHASALGGYSARGRAIPDLLSTYQVVLAKQAVGAAVDPEPIRRLLRRLSRGDVDYAWSPLGRDDGGPLAAALGALLDHATRPGGAVLPLPRLTL
jgi:prenyltransferase beta subunit